MAVAAYAAFRDTEAPFVVRAPSQDKAPQRYGFAIAVVLIAAVLRLVFLQPHETRAPFITFFPAVMLAALYGGLRAGALATLLTAALADYFWMEPAGPLIGTRPLDWLALAIFVSSCLLISWIVERLQQSQSRLRRVEAERRAELERMVATRTAELGLAKYDAELAHEAKSNLLVAATALEAELQAVIDAVPAGIWITRDPSYRTLQANRVANAWMRIPEGANASKSAPSLLHFEIFDKDGLPVPNEQLPIRRASRGEEVADYEFEWRFPDGESRSFYGNATPLRNAHGNIAGAVAAFIDITWRNRAEAALRESEERYRQLASAMPQLVWSASPDGVVDYYNARAAEYGITATSPPTNDDWAPAIHPDDLAPTWEAWGEAVTCGQTYQKEHRLLMANGGYRWHLSRAQPHRNEEGIIVKWFGTATDIDDFKQAEAALRESEARLQAVLDSSPDPIFLKDREGRLLLANPATYAAIGKPAAACLGKTDEEFLANPADGRAIMATDHRIMASGQAGTVEEMILTPSGTRYFVSNKAPFRDAAGNVTGLLGTARDVTERKRAEEALRESEERFRGIFLNAGTGIAITDLRGQFQSCNPAFSAMLGYSGEELLALDFQNLVHPEDREENVAVAALLRAQEISSFELFNRYIRRDGESLWVHKRVSLLRDAAGKPTHHVALVTDMSERKRHEEQVELLMREVNHRAKNMLALVQAIARQTVAATPDDFIGRFEERVRALAASQDLLVKNEWKGVDLRELIQSQLAHFKDLVGTRIELRGPSLLISASAAQTIGMALHELATNAGKYGALSSCTGRVEVAWSLERADGGEEHFVVGWRESGGPHVTAPAQTGFGSTVISRMAKMSLDARVGLEFAPAGLIWRLQCPSDKVLEGSGRAAAPPAGR